MKNWILLTAILALVLTGSSVFVIAQRMHHAQSLLISMNNDIKHERENLRVLQAEWTYLNNPDRLEKLAATFALQPIDGKQYVALNNMPTTEAMQQIELANADPVPAEAPAAVIPQHDITLANAVETAPAMAMPAPMNVSMTTGGGTMIRWCVSQNDGCQNPYQQDWTASKRVLTKTRSRMVVVMSVFVLAYGVVCGRMAQLTMENYIVNEEPDTPTAAKEIASMERADILDREGHLIATSLKTASIYADPKVIIDPTDAAKKLVSIFPDLDYNVIQQRLASKRRFVWIKRNLTPKQIYAANRLGLPGVNFIDEQRRIYPDGSLLAHAVGFTDVDHHGLAGLEKAYNKLLLDKKEPLQTTLDVRVQHILRKELQKSINDFTAIGGAGMVMDAKTGEIYAMVSLPDFDPHHPTSTPPEDLFNRLTAGVYEMGSTFKTFTTAELFENNGQNAKEVFDTTHPLRRAGFTISDFHPEPHALNVAEIMLHSSNIGAALMAEKIGTPKMKQFYKDLGFLDEVPIDLAERGRPLYPKDWRDINTLTASYGHGIAVTPLHLAVGVAAMVNGGYLPKPTFIKKPNESYELEKPQPVISEATSHMMRNVLRIVVSDGTGGNANIPGYHVGGKTGTAEKTMGNGYNHKALLSSFIGVFPIDDPKFVVVAFVDEPKPNAHSYGYATGGWTAAPVVGQVIKQMAPLVGIAPAQDTNLQAARQATGLMPQTFEGGRLASY